MPPTSPPPRRCSPPTRRATSPPRSGRLVASPDGSRAALTGLIEQAAQSLSVETEELTDPAIIAALLAARARGVAVTLVWPGPPDGGSGFAKLAAAGATVRALAAPTIHAKVVVADGRRLYLGSANFTPTSLDRNRELGLRLDDAAARAPGRRDRGGRRRSRRAALALYCLRSHARRRSIGPEGLPGRADRSARSAASRSTSSGRRKSCSAYGASRSRACRRHSETCAGWCSGRRS